MKSTAKILLTLVALTGAAGLVGAVISIGSYAKTEVASQGPSSATEALLPSQDEPEPEPISLTPDYEDGPGYGDTEDSDIDQVPISDENKGWTHIPCLFGKPREAVEKSLGDPDDTNENPTTPIWTYWKNEEQLCVGFGAILMDELLGQGRTFKYPMIVNGVSYAPQTAEIKIKEIIPLELTDKLPDYRVVFHEKRQQNPTSLYILTWVYDGATIIVKSHTTSPATSEERYYNRERGLHEWRYRINEEVLCLWPEGQVESYRQVGGNDPKYAKPSEVGGHSHIGKRGDWEVYF